MGTRRQGSRGGEEEISGEESGERRWAVSGPTQQNRKPLCGGSTSISNGLDGDLLRLRQVSIQTLTMP